MNKPFTKNSENSVSNWGEISLIENISKWMSAFPKVARKAPRGIGDDCAVLPAIPENKNISEKIKRIVTTDSLIFGKHFDERVPARNAGAKLIKRNASDIAAMGGVPADAVIALVMSQDTEKNWLKNFYLGICETCDALGIELCGGDVSSAPGQLFSATLALTGFAENPLLRSGAKLGDLLFVTGTLGGSIMRKHFDFTPRIAEGKFLSSLPAGTITACIDLTDGLKKDHKTLLPAGTHAEFEIDSLPISQDAITLGGNPVEHVFCDGEDYELLFCVSQNFENELKNLWAKKFPNTKLTRIGKIVPGEEPCKYAHGNAYEHFHH